MKNQMRSQAIVICKEETRQFSGVMNSIPSTQDTEQSNESFVESPCGASLERRMGTNQS